MTPGILANAWSRTQHGNYFWPNASDPAILNWEQGAGLGISPGAEKEAEEIPLQSRRLYSPAVATQAEELGTLGTHFLRLAQGKHQLLTQHCPNSSWPTL